MNAAQLDMSLNSEIGQEAGQGGFPVVSPYLQRPLRTLSEAKHDRDSALLKLTATNGRAKPAA
jgi:hypothetical protein